MCYVFVIATLRHQTVLVIATSNCHVCCCFVFDSCLYILFHWRFNFTYICFILIAGIIYIHVYYLFLLLLVTIHVYHSCCFHFKLLSILTVLVIATSYCYPHLLYLLVIATSDCYPHLLYLLVIATSNYFLLAVLVVVTSDCYPCKPNLPLIATLNYQSC